MDNHELFLETLQISEEGRWRIARWLSGRGYSVVLTPLRYAPTREQAPQHADNGDLYVSMRVEAKQLSCDFTARRDWPFGENFIVCSKNSYDKAQPKPYAYLLLSKSGTHVACVFNSSFPRWRVDTRLDSRFGERQAFYFAPLDAVSFTALEDQP